MVRCAGRTRFNRLAVLGVKMQQNKQFKRSDEPLWWGLFSAGGVCFAVFLPSVILFYGLLLPLGVASLDYQTASAWFFSFWGLVFVGATLILPAFHSLHRIRHTLHDLKIGQHGLVKLLSMGLAALISAASLLAWISGF